MTSTAIFFSLLFLLFFLSRKVSEDLSLLLYKFFRSKRIMVLILSLLFLPGTIIHELSHWLMAKVLLVYTGKINLIPKATGDTLKLGTVEVGKADRLRNFLIGVAPLIFGVGLIFITFWLFEKYELTTFTAQIIMFYLLFEIGNTMFSSKRDMESSVGLLIIVAILTIVIYLTGFGWLFTSLLALTAGLEEYFALAIKPLILIVIIDLVLISSAKILTS